MIPLKLGISTCPNDTFIYEHLVAGISHSPFQWQVIYADVQTLNEMVLHGELDVAKVSCGVLPLIENNYRVLSSGGAIGYGCGPLLLSSEAREFNPSQMTQLPGENTTAALLFRYWFENEYNGSSLLTSYDFFDQVYKNLCLKRISQGVVIHEHRFTWKRDGLRLIQDLGAYFETKTGAAIPLGCTVARQLFSEDLILSIEKEIQKSIDDAWNRNFLVTPFIKEKAQIEDDSVIEDHIRMFVTDFSYNMGKKGFDALKELFSIVKKN